MGPFNKLLTGAVSVTAELAEELSPVLSGIISGGKAMLIAGGAALVLSGGLGTLTGQLVAQIPALGAAKTAWDALWASATGGVSVAIGIVVGVGTAIYSLISGQESLADSAAKLSDEYRELAGANVGASQLVAEYEELNKKINKTSEDTARLNEISRELVASYGYRADGIDKEGQAIIENIDLMKQQLELSKGLEESKRKEAEGENIKAYQEALKNQNQLLERKEALLKEIEHLENNQNAFDTGNVQDIQLDAQYEMTESDAFDRVETRLPQARTELEQSISQLQSNLDTFATYAENVWENAKATAGEKGAQIPEQASLAIQQRIAELGQEGTEVDDTMAASFIDRYFAIDDAAGLAESKVAEIQNLRGMIVAQLATGEADTATAGTSLKMLLGNLTDESALGEALAKGQEIRAKIDAGIATPKHGSVQQLPRRCTAD